MVLLRSVTQPPLSTEALGKYCLEWRKRVLDPGFAKRVGADPALWQRECLHGQLIAEFALAPDFPTSLPSLLESARMKLSLMAPNMPAPRVYTGIELAIIAARLPELVGSSGSARPPSAPSTGPRPLNEQICELAGDWRDRVLDPGFEQNMVAKPELWSRECLYGSMIHRFMQNPNFPAELRNSIRPAEERVAALKNGTLKRVKLRVYTDRELEMIQSQIGAWCMQEGHKD